MNKKLILSIVACVGLSTLGFSLLRLNSSDQGGTRTYRAGFQSTSLEEHANTPPGMSISK